MYLERIQPEDNMARYYAMTISRSLFGDWVLCRSWGRIGRGGQTRTDWFDTAPEARAAQASLCHQKERRGYVRRDEVGCDDVGCDDDAVIEAAWLARPVGAVDAG